MHFKIFKDLLNIIPVVVYQRFKDENSIVVQHNNLLLTFNCLKKHIGYQFKLLSCISGVDFLGKEYRFSVVYDLLSLEFNSRLRVKVFTNEVTSLPSCTDCRATVNIFGFHYLRIYDREYHVAAARYIKWKTR